MKILTILRGIPGCGKSTVAEYFAKQSGAVICEADRFFYNKAGEYKFNPDKLGFAHSWCKKQCEDAMLKGLPVIVSNTSTKESELNPYMELAEKYGYMTFSLIVENRHGGVNQHDVPEETLEKMKNRFSIKL